MASKWIDGVLAVRGAAKKLRAARRWTSKGPAVYAAIHKATNVNKRLVRLAQERLATICRVFPKVGLSMTGAALRDGAVVFGFEGAKFVLKDFHMKSFRKDQFRDFGVDGGPWPTKDLAFSEREKALVKTHFRLARVADEPDSKHARMYREEAIAWYQFHCNQGVPWIINISPKMLFEAEFGWPAAFLVLYCSAEFRNLPQDIKKIIVRMVSWRSTYF